MECILHATLLLLTGTTASAFTSPIRLHHYRRHISQPKPWNNIDSTQWAQHVPMEVFPVNIQPLGESPLESPSTISSNSSLSSEESHEWLRWMSSGHAAPRSTVEEVEKDGESRSDRYASKDWWHNTLNLRNSAILRSILFPLLSMTGWSLIITCIYRALLHHGKQSLAEKMCIPSGPHSLTVSALGLLLVFRTNSAYQRFSEGRKIWEQILSTSRDLYRLCKLYESDIGTAKLRRVQRLLAAFPYLLRFRIRPNSIMRRIDDPDYTRDPEHSLILYQDHAGSDTDEEAAAVAADEETTGISRRKPRSLYWVDKRTLPWRLLEGGAMEECARAQNRPLWVCDRMAKELHSVPDSPTFTARERLTFLGKVEALSRTIGACERIHQTVVPLNYARHSLRSLTVWLFSLPFALVKELDLITPPVIFIISWMLFGVYEIGYTIEDPFQGSLRLSIICDAIRRDVLGDEIIRNTAFKVKDPSDASPFYDEGEEDYEVYQQSGTDKNDTQIVSETIGLTTSLNMENVTLNGNFHRGSFNEPRP